MSLSTYNIAADSKAKDQSEFNTEISKARMVLPGKIPEGALVNETVKWRLYYVQDYVQRGMCFKTEPQLHRALIASTFYASHGSNRPSRRTVNHQLHMQMNRMIEHLHATHPKIRSEYHNT